MDNNKDSKAVRKCSMSSQGSKSSLTVIPEDEIAITEEKPKPPLKRAANSLNFAATLASLKPAQEAVKGIAPAM